MSGPTQGEWVRRTCRARSMSRHVVPCRSLPLWLRVPRAVGVAMLLIVCVAVVFAVCPWFELVGPK